ncbi:uncharacterized protein LOC9637115 [Selaginella moellendorffii]|nr:uncharacterized protein LOC9637115 [Selaginella moellendorffii]|eukprot:XP_002989515.2 uncharacterized protein LOC9637115 [Selaginella moellendorffii]
MSLLLGGAKLITIDFSRPSIQVSDSARRNAPAATICSAESASARRSGLPMAMAKLAMVPLSVLAVSASCPDLAQAGILSGYRGWDFQLPQISVPDSLKENSEKQRKKYEEFDSNMKNSPLIKELLKRSKDNAAKRKQEIEDKYCERQAEWGVGDCSLEYSTPEEKEKFLELMKKRRAETEKLGDAVAQENKEEESTQPTAGTPLAQENQEGTTQPTTNASVAQQENDEGTMQTTMD